MQHALPLRTLALASVALLAACAGDRIRLAAAPLHPHSLDGHWVVDPSRSEDPDAALSANGGGHGGMGGGHGHGGGMGGGSGGMGGMGGGMGGMGGGRRGATGGGSAHGDDTGAGGGRSDMMRRALLLPGTLDIAMQPATLLIAPDGHPRSVPMVSGKDDADVSRAGWDGDSLVIVTHLDDKRGDIVQHYDVAADRSRLVVTTEFKGKSKTVSIVREFTAAPKGADASVVAGTPGT